jgi:hypothetical protein
MKYIIILSAGAVAVGIVLGMSIHRFVWGHEDSSGPCGTSVESVASESTEEAIGVTALKQKVAELHAQIIALNAQLLAEKAVGPKVPQAKAVDGTRNRSTPTDEWRDHVETVEDDFRHEPIDATWSFGATSSLQATISSSEAMRSSPKRDVECRSRTCRVEIADDGSGQAMQAMPALAMELQKTFPSQLSNRVDDGKGNHGLVLYLSRDDGSAMRPPSR